MSDPNELKKITSYAKFKSETASIQEGLRLKEVEVTQ